MKDLANLRNPAWIEEGKLTLVCEDIDNYQLPENVTLITLNRVLPYYNPLKMRALWDRLHHSVAEGGRLVGTFFPGEMRGESQISFVQRAIMNAWFIDIAAVRSLLNYKNFQKEFCEQSDFWFRPTRETDFIAKKSSTKPTLKGIFTLHLSSYFDAERGLPSSRFHLFPFLADRFVELREASKLTLLASGVVGLTQLLLGYNTSLASYTAIGSIAIWFFYKHITAELAPRVKAYIQKARAIDYRNSPELVAFKEKITAIQNHPEIQKVLNPPPPPPPMSPEDQFRAFLSRLGINPEQVQLVEEGATT